MTVKSKVLYGCRFHFLLFSVAQRQIIPMVQQAANTTVTYHHLIKAMSTNVTKNQLRMWKTCSKISIYLKMCRHERRMHDPSSLSLKYIFAVEILKRISGSCVCWV